MPIFYSLFYFTLIFAQTTISRDYDEFSIHREAPDITRTLRFAFDTTGTATSMIYHATTWKDTVLLFTNEMNFIREFYKLASDSISISLEDAYVGYPLEYADLAQKQVAVFEAATSWWKDSEQTKNAFNILLMREIMLKGYVYAPLNEFLNQYNRIIIEIQTEKHGFIDTNFWPKAFGKPPQKKIPMPFMVWLKIAEKADEKDK